MTLGKNKKLSKGGKRQKKKVVDAMARKEWYDVVAPKNFNTRQFAKTICTKTIGNKLASTNLQKRLYEANLGMLNSSVERDNAFRKIKFIVEDVQGRNLLTRFHGMDLTNDCVRSLLRKWCTTIDFSFTAKTADGYELRLFILAFTKRNAKQLSKNCYAKQRLVKWVRMRITKIVTKRLLAQDLNKVVSDLTQDVISDVLFLRCNQILPIRDVKIRKVKIIHAPDFNRAVLMDSHGEVPESFEDAGRIVEQAAEEAPVEA